MSDVNLAPTEAPASRQKLQTGAGFLILRFCFCWGVACIKELKDWKNFFISRTEHLKKVGDAYAAGAEKPVLTCTS